MKSLILFLSVVLLGFASVQAGDNSEPVAEMLNERLKSEAFSLGILIQAQGAYSFENTDFNGGPAWDLGSTRIDFRGTVDRNFKYRVRVYFLSQQQNIDARVGYRFSDSFEVIAGAFKPYLSRDLDPSPANLDMVRRARLVGAMMNTLEIGFSALGNIGNFKYRLGMYNGRGAADIAEQNDNRFFHTSRLAYGLEPADGHKLELGVNGAINRSLDEPVGNTGLTSVSDRLLYGGYLEYDSDLFFGTAEYLQSDFDAIEFDGQQESITGFYTTLGVKLDPRNEMLVRWDHLSLDLKEDESDRILVGWNYYPTSLVSFRFNALAEFRSSESTQFGLTGVFQYHF